MSSGIETSQAPPIEGVIFDDGALKFTATEQQRYVNLTHAMVFLKRDAHLAEICARKAHHLMREHLKECFRALVDIHCCGKCESSSEYTTRITDL